MTYPAHEPHSIARTARDLLPKLWVPASITAALLAFALAGPVAAGAAPFVFAAGISCGLAALAAWGLGARQRRTERRLRETVIALVCNDAAPALVADAEGRITHRNASARSRFGVESDALTEAFDGLFAAPRTALRRLQREAALAGGASEQVSLRRARLAVGVQRLGRETFLWRVETARDAAAEQGERLALPMIVASRGNDVVAMNAAAEALVGRAPRRLGDVIEDLPLRAGESHHIRTPTGTVERMIYSLELGERREIYLLPARVVGGDPGWHFFDALPVPLLRIARSGEVRTANRLARDLLAESMAEGTPLSSLVEGLGRPVSEWLADAVEGRGLNRSEVVKASRPSKEVYLQITLGRVEEDEGEVSLVAVLNDATELKTLEAQFVQSQKMQAIGQLAGGVAHDFNNLLTAISGHCDLLLTKRDEGDPDYADLAQIAQNANRAASLVGQLLAFSRKQNLQPQLLDVRESLSDLTHLLNRLVGERVALSVSHGQEQKMVRADKRQLEQVIMNLVVNARDAMPDGGRIRITTETVHLGVPLKRDRAEVPAGDYVVVRVDDNGTGIAPDKLPKIFEPFFTTKRVGEGTGLGLSTAYGIVKQTGGFIFADSEVGEGTAFSLYFPAHEAPPADEPLMAPDRTAGATQGEGLVLLVEDEAPVRAFASRALRMRGYTVIEAENAEDALKTLEDDSLHVDVFVTDVVMPGMDGPSWVKIALEKRPGTRVVFVSGYAEDSLTESQAKFPNSVFLPKPFSLKDLTETVHAQVNAG